MSAQTRPTGPGRVLVLLYGVFAFAATGRAAYQLVTKAGDAPLAYILSALSAVIYLAGFWLVRSVERGDQGRRPLAIALCTVELVGVLVVGTWSVVDHAAFPDASVWSDYGSGYGFVPVLIPVLALWWLLRGGQSRGSA